MLDPFVFVAYARKGWMVPNQYWTPGALSPMAIMGKYYMYYGNDFVPPRSLGRINAERFRNELVMDNLGMCRFHRLWAEEMLPEIVGTLFGKKDEYLARIAVTASRINSRNSSIFWESERNADCVRTVPQAAARRGRQHAARALRVARQVRAATSARRRWSSGTKSTRGSTSRCGNFRTDFRIVCRSRNLSAAQGRSGGSGWVLRTNSKNLSQNYRRGFVRPENRSTSNGPGIGSESLSQNYQEKGPRPGNPVASRGSGTGSKTVRRSRNLLPRTTASAVSRWLSVPTQPRVAG